MNAKLKVTEGRYAVVESAEFGIIGTARKVGHKWEFTSHRARKVYTFPTLKAAVAHAEEIAAYLKSGPAPGPADPRP